MTTNTDTAHSLTREPYSRVRTCQGCGSEFWAEYDHEARATVLVPFDRQAAACPAG